MIRWRGVCAVSVGLLGTPVLADWFDDRAAALYRPWLAGQVALAPDGVHLAYTQHENGTLSVVIVDVEHPARRTVVQVEDDRDVLFAQQKAAPELRYLRWFSPNRLLIVPTEQTGIALGNDGPKIVSPIFAVDADGQHGGPIADAADFATFVPVPMPRSTGEDDPPPPPPRIVPRHLRILGFGDGPRPGLLVEAIGSAIFPTTVFVVNPFSGETSVRAEEPLPGKFMYDHAGLPRLVCWQSPWETVRTYSYAAAGSMRRWVRVDEKWGGPLAATFQLSEANYYGEHAFPLGFDKGDRTLIYASNVGRDRFGIYGLDLDSRRPTPLAVEHAHRDLAPLDPAQAEATLVFDPWRRFLVGVRAPGGTPLTIWTDAELAGLQGAVEQKFSRRTVELLDWDAGRATFVVRVTGGVEPGRYFIYRRPENLLVEFFRRAPWLRVADMQESLPFAFDTPAGVHLTGFVTLPREPRLKPPPAIVYFADGFPPQAHTEFDRTAQMLAGMGFMVVRVNHRGTAGFGTAHREAILAGLDRVPVEDALAAIEWLAARHPIDRRRIATMGEGFGGFLALRALELRPQAFRCGVALQASLELDGWLEGPVEIGVSPSFEQEARRGFIARGAIPLRELSVIRDVEQLARPVFLMCDPQGDSALVAQNDRLRSQLRRLRRTVEYHDTPPGTAEDLPQSWAKVFRELAGFFNENLYNYRVDLGETKEVK
jgi:hypothetical protein